MKKSDIPNIISIIRIGFVIPVVVALLNSQFTLALLLFAVAGVSDGLDGYIAKRYHFQSRLGSILDPLADKLLLVSTYIALGWLGQLPLWLVYAVVGRDFLILCGALAYHYLVGQYEMSPTWISKINTFMQIILGLTVVFSSGVYALAPDVLTFFVHTVFVTTVLSGLDYVWTWGVRAHRVWAGRSGQ